MASLTEVFTDEDPPQQGRRQVTEVSADSSDLTPDEQELIRALEQRGKDPGTISEREDLQAAGAYYPEGDSINVAPGRSGTTLDHELIHKAQFSAGEDRVKAIADSVRQARGENILFEGRPIREDNIDQSKPYSRRPEEQAAGVLEDYVRASLGLEDIPAQASYGSEQPTSRDTTRTEFLKALMKELPSKDKQNRRALAQILTEGGE